MGISELSSNHSLLVRYQEIFQQLNEMGQLLTQQLDSAQVLQNLVDQIRTITKADVIALYPYHRAKEQFEFPPCLSGDLLVPHIPQPNAARSSDIASRALQHDAPIFAETSDTLYTTLCRPDEEKQANFVKREKIRSTVTVPLKVLQEPLGILFINFRQSQQFEMVDKHLILGLANYAAIAIKNAREFGSLTRRRARELEILQRIDREISKTLDLQQVLHTILTLTTEYIPADKAAILLYNPRHNMLEKGAVIGREAEASLSRPIPIDQESGITRWAFESQRPILVNNVYQDLNWRDIYIEAASDIRSELDVPLLTDDRVLGIINFESTSEDAFSQADQQFLVTLAGQVVLAIKNAQSYEHQKHLAEERRALNKIGRVIIQQLEQSRIFDLILDKSLEVTKSDVGTLMLYDPQRSDLWMAAERGVAQAQKGRRHSLDEGIAGWVAKNKKLLNVGDLSQPPWHTIHLPFIPGIRSELAVPLLEGNRLRGVINIESPQLEHFSEGDERLLTEFADLAVIALKNAESFREAKEGRAKLQALHNVDREIISQLDDYDHVMRTILKNAAILTQAERVGLHLYEEDGRMGDVYRGHLDDRQKQLSIKPVEATKRSTTDVKQGIVGYVARTHKPYITRGDAQNDPYYQGDGETHSEVAVPLLSGHNKLIGVLNLESQRFHAFDDEVADLMELFAGQAVIAIQNARAYATAKRRERRFQLLHAAAEQLSKIADLDQLDEAFNIVTRIAEEHSQSDVVIRRFNPDTEELVVVQTARWENWPPVSRVKLNEAYLSAWAARERQTLVIPDINNPPPKFVRLKPTDPSTQSAVGVPIQIEGVLYGNLALTYKKPYRFRSDDVRLVEGLAQQLAITIQRLEAVRAQQEAEQRALAAEVMGSIGQQAFELAHRLSNDLGLVRSYVNDIREELDEQGTANPSIESSLQKIVHDVQQVLVLSDDLKKELSEFRAKKAPDVERIDVSVELLLTEAVNAFPKKSSQGHIHFESKEIDGDVQVQVVPKQIAAILHNLFMNAIDAMPDGGIITLQTHKTTRYIEIDVTDTGVGITREKQTRIFDFLFSTKNSTGFGLWSARRIALENGGDLVLKDSQPEQGATFTLRLPRADVRQRGTAQ